MMTDDTLSIDFVGYSIMSRPWSSIKNIMAEFCVNPEVLKAALRLGHGIDVQEDIDKGLNPILFFEIDSEMAERLKKRGVDNPTMLQLIGTSRAFGRTAEECSEKFERLMRGDDESPQPSAHLRILPPAANS